MESRLFFKEHGIVERHFLWRERSHNLFLINFFCCLTSPRSNDGSQKREQRIQQTFTMKLMKAVFVTSFAPVGQVAKYFQFGDVAAPVPPLEKDQVICSVKAAGMSVEDLYVAQKSHAGGFFFLQIPEPSPQNPAILGCDFSGTVESVGSNVENLQVGDAVVGLNDAPNKNQQGVWCEHVLTTQDRLVKFDTTCLSFIDAAALVIPAFVATSMFNQAQILTRVMATDGVIDTSPVKCLVIGASGPIGSALIQLLCDDPKIQVTGVCSTENVDRVRKLGATEVLDYTLGSISTQLSSSDSFDCIFDLVGGQELIDETLPFLDKGGCIVTAVGPVRRVGSRILTLWEQTLFFYHLFIWKPLFNLLTTKSYSFVDPPDFTSDLFQPLVDADVKPMVEKIVPFNKEAISEAIDTLQQGKNKERLVLEIDPS